MKVVFMGTPEFAVGILDKLVTEHVQVVGVITAPDKPAGRGLKLSESAVKQYAVQHELHTLQPTNLKEPAFIESLQALNADLFVVVAFRMLPEVVWHMPPKGTINLHASLLPQYRGAAPINWVLINGEQETGLTTFFIEKEIDTGKVIERESLKIGVNETAGELHDRLMELGRTLIYSSVKKIEQGDVQGIDQGELTKGVELKAAPKLYKEKCQIDWKRSVQEIHNLCRGLSPYPTAWTIFEDEQGAQKKVKIFRTEMTTETSDGTDHLTYTKTELFAPCSDCKLKIIELQVEGKRRMSSQEFLAGNQNKTLKVLS